MADQDIDRGEAATPTKLKKAREQGQAARSADIVSAGVFAVAMVYVTWWGHDAFAMVLRACRRALVQALATPFSLEAAGALMRQLVWDSGAALLPFLVVLMAAGIAVSWMHAGWVLSAEPLKVDFERINPAAGFQRVFSLRTLFDTARSCVKLVVLVAVAWFALRALIPQLHHVAALPASGFLHTLVEDMGAVGLKMAIALLLVAAVDLLHTRMEFGRKMRMSRREIKDEHKNREGDPRIRARLRELRREMLKRSLALRNTRDADVVLTNPTHYAVALRYRADEMDAPRMVAKGAGQLAAAMREIAYRNRVFVVQNPPLARRLFREMAIEDPLPPAFHAEVARIFVWVFAMRDQRRTAPGGAA